MRNVYVVVTGIKNGEGCGENKHLHIDSVWTSRKKAFDRCDSLNADTDYLDEYGYTGFTVDEQFISK